MKKIGVALLGLGVVGYGTYRILTENREYIKKNHGVDVEVKHIIEKNISRVKELGIDTKIVSDDINDVLGDSDTQIVAEFFGGIEPAKSYLLSALKSGKSIVTANKELFSKHRIELAEAAKQGKAGLFFEASCIGGVPIIRTLTTALQGDNILSIAGIFNGTTNYILCKMTNEAMEYSDALKEAQSLGYAEANPTADVDGFDSMYKLSILASLAFHKSVPIEKIKRVGISNISKTDIEYGEEFRYTLKLLASAKCDGNEVTEAVVYPTFVPHGHPLASVSGSFNAVMIKGSNVGDIMLYGRGAGDLPTGSAIVSDIVYCAKNPDAGRNLFDDKTATSISSKEIQTIDATDWRFYVRMSVADKSGVLAGIANVFAKYNISISSLHQKESVNETTSIVFFTHETDEKTITEALCKIELLDDVRSVDAIIRVI
ncbi:MAG: homoserine dehydrogenase [Christensenellaceae bacterium]|jgi:homoserine dehydrogenase|nr:homoserine dehydrogenase [Christensenellaceae bacterium]